VKTSLIYVLQKIPTLPCTGSNAYSVD